MYIVILYVAKTVVCIVTKRYTYFLQVEALLRPHPLPVVLPASRAPSVSQEVFRPAVLTPCRQNPRYPRTLSPS